MDLFVELPDGTSKHVPVSELLYLFSARKDNA